MMTVLEVDYFEEILKTYQVYPDALGVEGILTMRQNGNLLETAIMLLQRSIVSTVGSVKRVRVFYRKKLGLDSDCPPGYSSYIRMVEVWVFTS
jgi:hypothetical protein